MSGKLSQQNVNNEKTKVQSTKQLVGKAIDFLEEVVLPVSTFVATAVGGVNLAVDKPEAAVTAFIVGAVFNAISQSLRRSKNRSEGIKEGAASAFQQLSKQTGLPDELLDKIIEQALAEKGYKVKGKQKPMQVKNTKEI